MCFLLRADFNLDTLNNDIHTRSVLGSGVLRPKNNSPGGLRPVRLDEPARRLGHEDNQHSLYRRRHGPDADHPAPPRLGRRMRRKQPADDVGHHLARGDEHDVGRDESSAVRRGRNLGNVERHDKARRADAGADDASPDDHERDRRADRLQRGADDEERIRVENHPPPPETIGEDGRDWRRYQRKEGGRGCNDRFVERRELPAGQRGADGDEGRGDDASVVWGKKSHDQHLC